MQKPEIPKNDDRRVEALEALKILDTDPEEQLDFITKIVKERLNVPIALISLVDKNRQWFKSKQGLSANETSRDISFCGHAILNTGVFEISNAIEDSRFKDNPLVLGEPNIRFYAGAPITTVDGYRIGTLCIIDNKARKLSQLEKEELEGFAKLVQSNLIKEDSQHHYLRLLDNLLEAIIEISMEGIILYVNQFGANLLGYKTEELIGKNLEQIIPKKRDGESAHKTSKKMLEHIAFNINSIYEADEDLMKKDGQVLQVACHLQPIYKMGKVSTMLMSFVDNFETNALKAELLWQQAQSDNILDARTAELGLRVMLEQATDGIYIVDMNGNLKHCSPSFAQMLGHTLDEMQSLNMWDWDAQLTTKEISDKLFLLTTPTLFETKYRRRDSGLIDVQVHAKMIQIDGKDCVYSSARDITEQKQELVQIAFYDPLTELANRRLLEELIHQAFSANQRSKSYCALLYLDLDNFKTLNDANGHVAGDLLLVEVAKRLKSCVREVDAVSRIGGDEFAVLIVDLNAEEVMAKQYALSVAEKIRLVLLEPHKLVIQSQPGEIVVKHNCPASIGLTLFSEAKKSFNELLKEADMAMYEAKHAGRNSVRLYQPN